MARQDPNVAAHLEWLGFVRPTGLVVSAAALDKAEAILNRRDAEGQQKLRDCVEERAVEPGAAPQAWLPDFRTFAERVLGWNFSPRAYAGTDEAPIPPALEAALPEAGAVLRPDFAVRSEPMRPAPASPVDARGEPESAGTLPRGEARESSSTYGAPADAPDWQLLVCTCAADQDFDRTVRAAGGLDASPQSRLERLLRHTGVPAGLLFNGVAVRLVSAPRAESSGWLDFRVADMLEASGRPIAAALRLLLGQPRLLSMPREKRLAALLADSRRYQNDVSERLAEQVLHALYELLRGMQAAHDASGGALLREPLREGPDEIYRALLDVLLRLVFLLYAEQRDLLPDDETFRRAYSLAALHERLREDAALHPDTMDQRHGAWAQLLALFRMVHDGAAADGMQLPPRHGALFDPDRHPFLEGRTGAGARQRHERIDPPLVPDGTIYRVLEQLLVLGGERVSYRALEVEHIGSVYETMMGFRLEAASGRSLAVKAAKKHGAPATVNLEALLDEAPNRRAKWVRDRTDRQLTDKAKRAVQAARTLDDLHAALDAVIDRRATPDIVPAGALVLQPSPERRRSGSHYTPRALTEPIVREALAPVLDRLRAEPGGARPASPSSCKTLRPEQILDLKVCDPAMGSGAFLVEACRQLGDALVEAWRAHGGRPGGRAGENDADASADPDALDDVVLARRLVAQRCLNGVDRNPVAVDLAKLSLWLATLARDESFTFLDHALRHGDSLVGLSRRQIEAFHWRGDAPGFQPGFEALHGAEHLARADALRQRIREADGAVPAWELRDLWDEARFEAGNVRLLGDLALAAFFEGDRPKAREEARRRLADAVGRGEMAQYRSWIAERRQGDPPLAPFHWEIEFPEVFERDRPGFDALVGNPPFAGKNTVAAANAAGYPDWLKAIHNESHGNADLVAHFFRRAFTLVRAGGAFGLIATNTIAQGDTRSTGLRWIATHGGEIYRARRRLKWPGLAAVVVSVVHICKGPFPERGASTLVGIRGQGNSRAVPAGGASTATQCDAEPVAAALPAPRILDEAPVERITAFLFHRGGHDDPARLAANAGKSFQGSIVLGMGFTFDDTDTKGVASPLAEMERLIAENPRNREAIFPYIGGEEVNTSPTHAHHRWVINFRDYPLRREDLGASWADAAEDQRRAWLRKGVVPADYPGPVAADWPALLAMVEERVKPERDVQKRKALRERWWHYAEKRPGLYAAVAERQRAEQHRAEVLRLPGVDIEIQLVPDPDATADVTDGRVLVNSQVSQRVQFAFLPSDMVYAHTLNIFPLGTYAAFCILQSRPHETWARFFGSSLEDRLRYTPSDCFETFPFPAAWETQPALEDAGRQYYDFRAALLQRNDEGLTKTYNRFHDPDDDATDIAELRRLHAAMDRAVLDAYGWPDVPTDCDFLLDHPLDDDETGARKKPYRYRWPDAVRDEVLARLLELNAQRAAEETRSGKVIAAKKSRPRAAPSQPRPAVPRAAALRVAETRSLWGSSDK